MGKGAHTTPVFLIGAIRSGLGKSTLVANLAVYWHSRGRKTAVVDFHAAFPMQVRAAFPRTTVLESYADAAELANDGGSRFRRTFFFNNLEQISFFPAFKLKQPARLLSDTALRDFFLQLRTTFDVVLVNLPPGGEGFTAVEAFTSRGAGRDPSQFTAVLVSGTDLRSLTAFDQLFRERPALDYLLRERLLAVFNRVPRGVEEENIANPHLAVGEIRRMFRIPALVAIQSLDDFPRQALEPSPLVLSERSPVRQAITTLARSLQDLSEQQYHWEDPEEDDPYLPCLDRTILDRLAPVLEEMPALLARRLFIPADGITTFVEVSQHRFRLRVRLVRQVRPVFPIDRQVAFRPPGPLLGPATPAQFPLTPTPSMPRMAFREGFRLPKVTATPLYHFDDRFDREEPPRLSAICRTDFERRPHVFARTFEPWFGPRSALGTPADPSRSLPLESFREHAGWDRPPPPTHFFLPPEFPVQTRMEPRFITYHWWSPLGSRRDAGHGLRLRPVTPAFQFPVRPEPPPTGADLFARIWRLEFDPGQPRVPFWLSYESARAVLDATRFRCAVPPFSVPTPEERPLPSPAPERLASPKPERLSLGAPPLATKTERVQHFRPSQRPPSPDLLQIRGLAALRPAAAFHSRDGREEQKPFSAAATLPTRWPLPALESVGRRGPTWPTGVPSHLVALPARPPRFLLNPPFPRMRAVFLLPPEAMPRGRFVCDPYLIGHDFVLTPTAEFPFRTVIPPDKQFRELAGTVESPTGRLALPDAPLPAAPASIPPTPRLSLTYREMGWGFRNLPFRPPQQTTSLRHGIFPAVGWPRRDDGFRGFLRWTKTPFGLTDSRKPGRILGFVSPPMDGIRPDPDLPWRACLTRPVLPTILTLRRVAGKAPELVFSTIPAAAVRRGDAGPRVPVPLVQRGSRVLSLALPGETRDFPQAPVRQGAPVWTYLPYIPPEAWFHAAPSQFSAFASSPRDWKVEGFPSRIPLTYVQEPGLVKEATQFHQVTVDLTTPPPSAFRIRRPEAPEFPDPRPDLRIPALPIPRFAEGNRLPKPSLAEVTSPHRPFDVDRGILEKTALRNRAESLPTPGRHPLRVIPPLASEVLYDHLIWQSERHFSDPLAFRVFPRAPRTREDLPPRPEPPVRAFALPTLRARKGLTVPNRLTVPRPRSQNILTAKARDLLSVARQTREILDRIEKPPPP